MLEILVKEPNNVKVKKKSLQKQDYKSEKCKSNMPEIQWWRRNELVTLTQG